MITPQRYVPVFSVATLVALGKLPQYELIREEIERECDRAFAAGQRDQQFLVDLDNPDNCIGSKGE